MYVLYRCIIKYIHIYVYICIIPEISLLFILFPFILDLNNIAPYRLKKKTVKDILFSHLFTPFACCAFPKLSLQSPWD